MMLSFPAAPRVFGSRRAVAPVRSHASHAVAPVRSHDAVREYYQHYLPQLLRRAADALERKSVTEKKVYSYRTPVINNSLQRSISIDVPAGIWQALDDMARKKNISKQALLRPVIFKFVEARDIP